ncbi:MAG: helix-turn-helix transcriptional regulator, partial [Eubacterium sp.]|nr:helix-turn-helix transcriptional regulator [Eubacterium sp.]
MANEKISVDITEKITYEDYECEEKTSIGAKMAYCRKFSELSLEEMSEYLKINASLLNEYEKDITQPPLKFLLHFSKTFDIP